MFISISYSIIRQKQMQELFLFSSEKLPKPGEEPGKGLFAGGKTETDRKSGREGLYWGARKGGESV